MLETAASFYRRMLIRWVDLVRRGAWAVVVASVLAAAGGALYVVENFSINTSTSDMLAPDLPFRKNARIVDQAFPHFNNTVLVVIDGETPDLADDAATVLADAMRRRPGVFGAIYDLAGDPFFRRNGLLYLNPDELYDLSDDLAEAQPFLGTLWRDPSLRGLFHMLELAIDETLKEEGDPPIRIATVLTSMAEVVEAQATGRFKELSWRRLMMGAAVDAQANRRFIVIQPVLDFSSLQPASKGMRAVRRLAAENDLDPAHGVRVRLTGSAALAEEELRSVEQGMGLAALLSLTLVLGLLSVGLRSGRLIVATAAALIMGLIWTAAFAFAAIGALNLMSVAFAVLFIGLSVDFGIHFGLRYQEAIDARAGHAEALRRAASGVGGALTLCAVAAAIGFYSFLPTDYLGLAELGLIAGTGMFVALFANMTVLPAFLTLMPLRPTARTAGVPGWLDPARRALENHPRRLAWGALVLGVAAAALLPATRFDFDPLNLKDRNTESVSTLFEIMADDSRAGPYALTVLGDDLEAAVKLAGRLSALAEVDEAVTLESYLPADQEEKLEIIDTMALFLAPSLASADTMPPPSLGRMGDALGAIRARLRTLAASAKKDSAAAAGRLARAFDTLFDNAPPEPAALRELEARLLSSLPNRLRDLKESLGAETVALKDLPRDLVARQVAADGRARIKVYPTDDIRERAALVRFIDAVRTVAPRVVGPPVAILEGGNAVVRAFGEAAVLAVVLISILLAVLLRGFREILLVFAPLVLAALLTNGASVIFNLPFNFANVIVLPLLFGLGVAGGLHLVLRERVEKGVSAVLGTSTPRAVIFSALTTIGSFGSIALSSHPGTASMGVLLTIAISLTLLCTLVVLPALMAITGGRGAR